jgi:hypothetical protein
VDWADPPGAIVLDCELELSMLEVQDDANADVIRVASIETVTFK